VLGASLIARGFPEPLASVSGFVPRVVGSPVALAGTGYLVDSLGGLLYARYTFELASLTFVGEVVFMVGLLLFGAHRPRNQSHQLR
jgi:hypothetical protein